MKSSSWLIINKNGIKGVRKTKPALDWDEIAVKIRLEVPNQLFERPQVEAILKVDDIPNNSYSPEILVNTADLIEQQTGAKVVFSVVNTVEAREAQEASFDSYTVDGVKTRVVLEKGEE